MSITHNSNIVVNLSPGGVSGWPGGMGVHRLRFSVQYQSPARKETFVAHNFRATVTVSRSHEGGAYLGIAWPESAWALRTATYAQNAALLFDFDLRSEQLALIEDLRGGGDLVFNLHFLCEVSHDNDTQRGDDDVRYYVNKSSWIACMKQFGLDRIVLLEVDLPDEVGSLQAAVSLLKRAREELDAGNYDGVVQQCRRAIESVQKSLKLKPAINAAMETFARGDRKTMSKSARALVVNEAALHYSHPAHHVDEDGQTFDYGRRDATFMLALASAVVANGAGGAE
jgi:hypothetical protein